MGSLPCPKLYQHRGAELSLNGNISQNTRVIIGGLYLNGKLGNPTDKKLDGKRPAGVPEFQANIFVDHKLTFIKGLDVNGGLFFTGDRFADNHNTFTIDRYTRLDLGVRYGFKWGKTDLTARLNVRNVTNSKFIEGSTGWGSISYGSPATAVFSLAARF